MNPPWWVWLLLVLAVIAEGERTLDLDPAVDRERVHARIVKEDFPERAAAQTSRGVFAVER